MTKHIVKIIYGITLAASVMFFSYYLFPAAKIQENIMMVFVRALPDYQLMTGNAEPAFPIALKLSKVKIFRQNEEFIEADFIKIGLPVFALFSSERSFSINCRAYDGAVSGTVGIREENADQTMSGKFKIDNMKLENIQPLQQKLKEKISGTLGGIITFGGQSRDIAVDFNLTLTNAAMPLAISFIRMGEITFDDIDIEGALGNGNLSIGKCVFQGQQLNGQFSGDITLADPVEKSRLNLSGAIKPHHDLLKNLPKNLIPANLMTKEGIPFSITGTYEKPGLSFR